jgi:hypothetical protein
MAGPLAVAAPVLIVVEQLIGLACPLEQGKEGMGCAGPLL